MLLSAPTNDMIMTESAKKIIKKILKIGRGRG